jgi:hypothetical protein
MWHPLRVRASECRLVSQATYIAYFSGAARVLSAREGALYAPVPTSLHRELALSWQVDTQQNSHDSPSNLIDGMTFSQFYAAVFELIDLWTNTVALEDYVLLSNELFNNVARCVCDFLALLVDRITRIVRAGLSRCPPSRCHRHSLIKTQPTTCSLR